MLSAMASRAFFSGKNLLLSTGVLSAAVAVKLWLPAFASFLSDELPLLYSSFLAWLTPPYLYFVLNGIIITIAASSRFQYKAEAATSTAEMKEVYETPVELKDPVEIRPDFDAGEIQNAGAAAGDEEVVIAAAKAWEEGDDFGISRSDCSLSSRESMEIPAEFNLAAAEKPLVSARFGHRKSVKASPEGSRALRVAKPKRNETLENTWKAITERRAMPLTRHLKKSETFESLGRRTDEMAATPMKKSETFKEKRTTPSLSRGSGKLRRDPSPSQDDLNRRVEAFIKKFNEEMRLQRQESFKHYMEMVNRGSH